MNSVFEHPWRGAFTNPLNAKKIETWKSKQKD